MFFFCFFNLLISYLLLFSFISPLDLVFFFFLFSYRHRCVKHLNFLTIDISLTHRVLERNEDARKRRVQRDKALIDKPKLRATRLERLKAQQGLQVCVDSCELSSGGLAGISFLFFFFFFFFFFFSLSLSLTPPHLTPAGPSDGRRRPRARRTHARCTSCSARY